MNVKKIINHWTISKSKKYFDPIDLLALEISQFYSNIKKTTLISLNLLDMVSCLRYWFIDKDNGELYWFILNINNAKFDTIDDHDYNQVLLELGINSVRQITCEIHTDNNIDNVENHLMDLLTYKCENSHCVYYVKTMCLQEKITESIKKNKKTNKIKQKRKQIIKEQNKCEIIKKRKLISDVINECVENTVINDQDLQTDQIKSNQKKQKIIDVDWNQMVPASAVRNFILNDPLIDFLREYNINSIYDKPSVKHKEKSLNHDDNNNNKIFNNNQDAFTKHIMDAGIEFENELVELISKSHKIIKVANFTQGRCFDKYEETIELMKKGVPIIYQGVLHDYENSTYGIPDLIVRSDYVNELMGYKVISDKETKVKSDKLDLDYHYKIIDIKHSVIPLRADKIHIQNSESIHVYKAQLFVYTQALNRILGVGINKAYIWGKKYVYESCGKKYEETQFLNKLGVIDYDNIDSEYIANTKDAIKWIQTVKSQGIGWSLLPIPSRGELFPNMKNDKDGKYKNIKKELNEKIHEITNVWYCGVKKRQAAHMNNVYGWNDLNCTSKIMGFPPGKIAGTVDAILDINRQNVDLIRPEKITWDRKNWHTKNKDTIEFYLDFETLNSNFGSIIKDGIISYNPNQFIFMIGVGYIKKSQWIFQTFIMKQKTLESEREMFDDFIKYIEQVLGKEKKKHAKMFHWSFAEVCAYNNFKTRHGYNPKDSNICFYDLNKVFINEPVTINGALDFSLKSIAKALKSHNLIESSWDTTSVCSNGLNAMILANNIYENTLTNTYDIEQNPVMKEIIHYNQIDCKVMWEIHKLIRKNN